jgi:hypothetical protein
MLTVAHSFWDDMLDPLKITFDGVSKRIFLNTQYNVFNIKIDVYSAAKRWLQRRQNLGYPAPLRAIGGDPLVGGLYAGDIYFLINGWRIVVNHQVTIQGTLYNDDVNTNPYIINAGGGVIATVSNLAYSYNTVGAVVPTAEEVANTVWNKSASSITDPTTVGGKVINTSNKVDTIKTTTDNILATNI